MKQTKRTHADKTKSCPFLPLTHVGTHILRSHNTSLHTNAWTPCKQAHRPKAEGLERVGDHISFSGDAAASPFLLVLTTVSRDALASTERGGVTA